MIPSQEKPNATYCAEYDAYYDCKTGEWLEEKCGDINCEFCNERPDKFYRDNIK
jgi:hypothetical protein